MSDCRCCTPMTRLYLVIGESREYLEAMLQRLLCSAFSEARLDAVPLVHTTSFDRVCEDIRALRRLGRGALLTSFPLGAAAMNCEEECVVVDADTVKLGAVDTLASRDYGVECKAILPHAIAACIPRGYSALVAAKYRWEVKLALSALVLRGYQRVIVTGEIVPVDLTALGKVYGIDVDVVPLSVAEHYTTAVDINIDYGILGKPGAINLNLSTPGSITPCILSQWVSRAILFWENVFIDPKRLQAIFESLRGS